ncbi:universal stress protein [Labedaea rhizosphaerae]|uniref:Nucleotide-binding universal stress UspA family protein n=1 Tax=Labedaea rhizosphaerae TaxID=598644 RepID=A0A4R6SFD6_LABRH|nr:universal stress protein [Labedaea rhizosphaerae]TDQ00413.1 nucleotide-binding universal stress UspA family protein [Labedaea rhizosphaerae]
MSAPKPMIVVGLDGSEAAAAALDWAMAEGECRGYTVEVVTVWRYFEPLADRAVATGPGSVPGAEIVGPHAGMVELAEYIHENLATAVAHHPKAEYRHVQLGGRPPGETLVRAAADAAMLVVGSHGSSGVLPALLGSVSAHCVRHAPCPVVIVRADTPRRHGHEKQRSVVAGSRSHTMDPTPGPLL